MARERVYNKLSEMKADAAKEGFEFMQRLGDSNNFLFENPEAGMRVVYTPYGANKPYQFKSAVCGSFHQPEEFTALPIVCEDWEFGRLREGEQ